MTDTPSIETKNILPSQTPKKKFVPKGIFPSITSFMRRFWALWIDMVLLEIVGAILGLMFSSELYKIGPYGSPLGLLFILPYFGIMDSKISGGQTIGKRLLKIAVRDSNNQPISLGRSITRILLLVGPYFLAEIIGLFTRNIYITCLENTLMYGWGAALIYTMIFNKVPRQGLHDMLMHTYVVDLEKKKLLSFPVTSRTYWIVSIVCIFVVNFGFLIATIVQQNNAYQVNLQTISNTLMTDPQFFSANISALNYRNTDGNAKYLQVSVWYKGKITEADLPRVSEGIAKVVLASAKDLNPYDDLRINVSSKYTLGIASFNENMSAMHSIADWRKIIDGNSSSG